MAWKRNESRRRKAKTTTKKIEKHKYLFRILNQNEHVSNEKPFYNFQSMMQCNWREEGWGMGEGKGMKRGFHILSFLTYFSLSSQAEKHRKKLEFMFNNNTK